MAKPLVDIIIPTFNGKYLLEKHLPKVIKYSDHLSKVIVVDNGSTDGTVQWLSTQYPQVQVLRNTSNLGFTKPINQGVSVSDAEYLVLLNNDVEPIPDYLKNIFRFFAD